MSSENVQNQAVSTYNENIAYFKEHHQELYNNLVLFETAQNTGQLKAQYDLQYKDNYFDIIGLEQNIPFYGQNSIKLTQKMVESGFNFDATHSSFKTYYERETNQEIADQALEFDMLARYDLTNTPLVHYTKKNLPKSEIMQEIYKFIIFGVGLGVHIPILQEKIKSKLYLIVEPSLEIFKLSLFVTNYAQLAKETKFIFAIAQSEFDFRKTFNIFYSDAFVLNHYLKFFKFSQNCDMYMKTIQNSLVSQSHYLYAYDRTFLSLLRTHSYITQGYRTLNISQVQSLELLKKPILYLAAGPSLQRQIDFVKKNQDKYIIVAIYATLPILEENEIKPDIVTQYDEQDRQVLNTLDKIKNIEFFNDTIFIFSSHVNSKLMHSFPKKNIFIFQAMFELKKEFGLLTSPSIGELTYALLLKLGATNISILGLDLAMDSQTNQTHIDGHSGSNVFSQLKELEDSDDKAYSYRKNTISIKGNFQPEVKSIPVFKTNIDSFNNFTAEYKPKDCQVYNLSNGAYLKGTTPTRIEDIDFTQFDELSKETLKSDIEESLKRISEENYNEKDLESIHLKVSGAKKIKKYVEQFYKIKKYKTFEDYRNKLLYLLNAILFEKNNCDDLQSILTNYTSHVMHHVFHLFNTHKKDENKKYIYEINKILNIQLTKIINTYVISILYSKEENNLSKKLNKFIKEYSIKDSIYTEPFLKELAETSLRGKQESHGDKSIGFFATEDNLSNKEFISYIKDLVKQFPDIKLKLFYFFDYQQVLAKHTFKQILENITLIKPDNIENISLHIEVWIETSEKTFSLRKVNDIILHNYSNIHSIMFKSSTYKDEIENFYKDSSKVLSKKGAFSLKDLIKKDYVLPNTRYYRFADNLKSEINEKKILNSWKKGYLGFFAFEENLTKDFIQNILNIYNQLANIKFTVFYFNEKQKEKFELQFNNLLSRFEFVIPKNIYDILENIEIWTQAKIKNQSFLFTKISQTMLLTKHIFSTELSDEYKLQSSKEDYLDALVPNYHETKFTKSLNTKIDKELLNNLNKGSIGFFASNDNLKEDFIANIFKIYEQFPQLNFTIFYFELAQKNLFEKKFKKILNRCSFIVPNSITDIINGIEIWFQANHQRSNNLLASIYNVLNQTNCFTVTINSKYKIQDIYNNTDYKHALITNFDEVYLLKGLQIIKSIDINNMYEKNLLSFFGTYKILQDLHFTDYIKQLYTLYPNLTFHAYCFNTDEQMQCQKIFGEKITAIVISDIADFKADLFISYPRHMNLLSNFIMLECNKIYPVFYSEKLKDVIAYEKFFAPNYFLLDYLEEFNLTQEDIQNVEKRTHPLLYNKLISKLTQKPYFIDKTTTLYNLKMFEDIKFAIEYEEFREFYFLLRKRQIAHDKK